MEAIIAGAFFIGLLSTLHCVGMCGGIVGALTFSLPEAVRARRGRLAAYVSAYNLGRITSYTAAGALGGWFGARLFEAFSPRYGYRVLQGLAAVLMVGIGLYLAGWLPRFAVIERIGAPVWQRLEPLGRRLLPVRTPWHAYAFGLVWGWLPCGLVYTMLLWTTASGSAAAGALFMLAFGAGTLPPVMATGIVTGWIVRFNRQPWLRRGAGLAVIALALVGLYLGGTHGKMPAPGAGVELHARAGHLGEGSDP